MYNGIGLQTPRGSGTNGYIQSNKFFLKPKSSGKVVVGGDGKGFEAGDRTAGLLSKKPNKDILEHDRKRQLHLKLAVLEDKLLDQGFSDAEISEKLEEARKTLEASASASEGSEDNKTGFLDGKVSETQTHQIAARKEKKMEIFRAALGIRDDKLEDDGAGVVVNEGVTEDQVDDAVRRRERSEHAFLDRETSWRKPSAEDLKSGKDDNIKAGKKKGGRHDEVDEPRQKRESRRRRRDGDSSDTDSDEQGGRHTQKKQWRHEQESESEYYSDGRRKKGAKSSKKHGRRRRRRDDSTDSGTDSNSYETEKDRRSHKRCRRLDRSDSEEESPKHRAQKREPPREKQRHDSEDSESNSGDGIRNQRDVEHRGGRKHKRDEDDRDYKYNRDGHKKDDAEVYGNKRQMEYSEKDRRYGNGGSRERKSYGRHRSR